MLLYDYLITFHTRGKLLTALINNNIFSTICSVKRQMQKHILSSQGEALHVGGFSAK